MNTPLAQNVTKTAAKWTAKHPDLAARIERAIALVASVQPGDFSRDVYRRRWRWAVHGSHRQGEPQLNLHLPG